MKVDPLLGSPVANRGGSRKKWFKKHMMIWTQYSCVRTRDSPLREHELLREMLWLVMLMHKTGVSSLLKSRCMGPWKGNSRDPIAEKLQRLLWWQWKKLGKRDREEWPACSEPELCCAARLPGSMVPQWLVLPPSRTVLSLNPTLPKDLSVWSIHCLRGLPPTYKTTWVNTSISALTKSTAITLCV